MKAGRFVGEAPTARVAHCRAQDVHRFRRNLRRTELSPMIQQTRKEYGVVVKRCRVLLAELGQVDRREVSVRREEVKVEVNVSHRLGSIQPTMA